MEHTKANRKKFEYKTIDIPFDVVQTPSKITTFLDGMGEEGWELIVVVLVLKIAVFKREVVECHTKE